MASVAILVPVYREELQPDEEYSVRHLRKHLGQYDCWQISPESLSFRLAGLAVKKYADSFFTGVAAYSRLCLSAGFYEDFARYDYILIYQLDCLVFKDDLPRWCEAGYDYVGAPVFRIGGNSDSGFSGACNGGLSLRKVDAFLKVLNSRRYSEDRVGFLSDMFHRPFVDVRPGGALTRWRKRLQVAREVRCGVGQYTAEYTLNEDHFWSGRAAYFYPAFNIAPSEAALSFAFEVAPRACFERLDNKLPFGAHAWQKWDREFWEPFLLR